MKYDTTKRISFRHAGRIRNLTVKLDGLSPLARKLAETLVTTLDDEDFAAIWVRHPMTREESARITEHLQRGPHADFAKWRAEFITKFNHIDGEAYLAVRPQFRWDWGGLRRGATPEQFFERHAQEMLDSGVEFVGARPERESWRFAPAAPRHTR